MPKSTPYIAAAGAVGVAWLIENWDEVFPSAASSVPRQPGMTSALETAAARMPCNLPRLSSVTTLTGAEIRRLPSGAGEDFLREYFIQRFSLCRAVGDLAIPRVTQRPRLTARCAKEWIELWLDAWQLANAASPTPFAIESVETSADWFSFKPLPGHVTYERAGSWRTIAAPARLSSLGRDWQRLRALHAEATAVGIVGGAFGVDEQVWIGARRTAEAIHDFALEMDAVGFDHGDARAQAIAQLRKDLHPVQFARKAVDLVTTPVEGALEHVVGPVLAALLGALSTSLGPLLIVGGAVYLIARRAL